ncbi:ribbon-helix-helix protein, CopG family [Shimia sp. R9_3]|uniref:ribbon-helix-helix protein, CopG family n=1 Tax=Shimia sp. R9_3 TaxID=2821113 RepID=UPI001AD9D59B|nr:ribbon-helix-helix protein, CopG family [Shimia sp. R9_3]MBO9400764.1 ribbon-helix-helix protein, CopG family [Shimia sp. R9_3]
MANAQRVSSENSKFRFTVDVSRRLADEIENIAKDTGRSKAEVFRLAIELLSTAREARREGMHVGAWEDTDDHRREREFVNFG